MKGGEAVGKFVVYVPKTICCTERKEGSGVGWLALVALVYFPAGLSALVRKRENKRVGRQ